MSKLPTELLWVFNTPQWWQHPPLSVPQSLMQMRPLLGDDNYPDSWRQGDKQLFQLRHRYH